jgi:uncharacterized protein (TIGR01244 family)
MTDILSYQHRLDTGTIIGGEPGETALIKLKEAGFTTLISLRGEGESPFGASHFEAHGFKFTHLPISGPGDFTPAFLTQFDTALSEAEGPTAVFCATGNRVGAAFALHANRIKGLSAEDSLALGIQAGLTRLAGFVQQQLTDD